MPRTTLRPGMAGGDYVFLNGNIQRRLVETDVRVVARYFVNPSSTRIDKDYKPAEDEWMAKHGIAVIPNFERHHLDSNGGAAAADRNMTDFLEQLDRFNVPTWSPVIVSADTDVYSANIGASEDYMRACERLLAAEGYTRFGGYMDDDLAYRLLDLDPIVWRPNALGWDNEPRPTPVHMQQHRQTLAYGTPYDPNTVMSTLDAWIPGDDTPTDPTGRGPMQFTILDEPRLLADTRRGDWAKLGATPELGMPADVTFEIPIQPTTVDTPLAVKLNVTVTGPDRHGHIVLFGNDVGNRQGTVVFNPGERDGGQFDVETGLSQDGKTVVVRGILREARAAKITVELVGVWR